MIYTITERYKNGSGESFVGSKIQRYRNTVAIVTKNGVVEIPKRRIVSIDEQKGIINRDRDRETH